ncbi:hypothetical protein ATANTOWER_006116 [Ataeniobius toweri]|uniref:Uncharacterized protein n=1 Tax=Ataeniobius toweri TaxID=208326 RepID=A0ABU7AUF2_9TELE|nr:hypothetical protein [Ataeniobius toweri]
MKLNPHQAPLYGRCVVTVQLSDEELAADGRGVDYFLLFSGSTQRHLTSTLRSSHDTLQALCPEPHSAYHPEHTMDMVKHGGGSSMMMS